MLKIYRLPEAKKELFVRLVEQGDNIYICLCNFCGEVLSKGNLLAINKLTGSVKFLIKIDTKYGLDLNPNGSLKLI